MKNIIFTQIIVNSYMEVGNALVELGKMVVGMKKVKYGWECPKCGGLIPCWRYICVKCGYRKDDKNEKN